MNLLKIRSVSVSFGGLAALKKVDVDIRPGEIVGLIGPNGAGKTTLFVHIKVAYSSDIPDATFVNTYFPFLSYMFLHGGFLHLIGNMWYLWIFGDNIEDRLGRIRFILFYFICGVGAASVHVYFNSQSGIPCVGASGAIAGVLGAYMVTFPRARVQVIIPLFIIWQIIELPAIFVLGFWFLIQFFSSVAAISSAHGGGVAWWAHIGGFILGIIIIKIFPKSRYRHV